MLQTRVSSQTAALFPATLHVPLESYLGSDQYMRGMVMTEQHTLALPDKFSKGTLGSE